MGHALSCRSNLPLFQINPLSNPALLGSVVLTTLLQLMLLYVQPLAQFFGTTALDLDDLLVCIGFALLFFLYLEAAKIWRLWRRQASANT
jgi:Ca2+-transporting ATPase